ncbi:MAG: phosphate ABC transporter substrate-binding protein PstS family protein [Firmicutes bacterium]|nr:phosphate ABC transporter substrate-binding protein PstS family protein [Bacillota bacterium]
MLTKGELSKEAKAYLDFIMSDKGQEVVAENLIPVNSSDSEAKEYSGTVEVVGSTSVTPVAQKLSEAFMEKHSDVKVNVQGIGSTAGVKAANDGTADVGMASRNLKEGEKEWGLDEHVIAYDGIAVVAHPNNNVSDLDKETVTKIFKGEIKNWKEVGGNDKDIVVVSREAGSGTRGAFEGIMNLEKENDKGKDVSAVTKEALIAEGNGAVRANIAKKENAIGYISLAYMNDTVKGIKIEGAEPTVENIMAGDYKVSRPFLMLTKGEVSDVAKGYLDFIMSEEGQSIVAEKLIPVK